MNLAELVKRMKSGSVQGSAAPSAARPPEITTGLVPVTITGNVGSGSGGSDAGGYYTGTIKLPPASDLDDDGGNLALGEGMLDGDTCVIINAEETGLPTHWLKSGAYQLGQALHVESDGKQVLMVDGGAYRTASPSTLDANDSKEWRRDEKSAGGVYGDTAVEVYVACTSSTGTNAAARKFTFDAGGKNWKIGPEAGDLTVGAPTVTADNPNVGDTLFVWNGVYVVFPGTITTGTGTSGDPYVASVQGGDSFTVTQGPDGGADVDVTHDTGVAVLSRGFEILFIFGENTTLDATNTSPTTQGFWAGSDNDNMDLSAVPSMPAGWAATWRIQGGTLRVKFTAIPNAGNSMKIAGVVRRTPPLVDT